jgi:hypothetical protein
MANPKQQQPDNATEINRLRTEHLGDKGAAGAPANAPKQGDSPGSSGPAPQQQQLPGTNYDQGE